MESYPFDEVTPEPTGATMNTTSPLSQNTSRGRRIATGAVIGVAVFATGGVAMAATHSGGSTAQGGPGEKLGGPPGSATPGNGPAGNPRPGPGRGEGPGGVPNALHGTFVVPAATGTGTTTEDLQTGKVTAVSATSIAVVSSDKVAATFAVTPKTVINHGRSKIGALKVGEQVTVIATDADKTAISIEDRALNWGGGGFHGGFRGSPPSGAPSTTTPSTTDGEHT